MRVTHAFLAVASCISAFLANAQTAVECVGKEHGRWEMVCGEMSEERRGKFIHHGPSMPQLHLQLIVSGLHQRVSYWKGVESFRIAVPNMPRDAETCRV